MDTAVLINDQNHSPEPKMKLRRGHILDEHIADRIRQPFRALVTTMGQQCVQLHMHPSAASQLNAACGEFYFGSFLFSKGKLTGDVCFA